MYIQENLTRITVLLNYSGNKLSFFNAFRYSFVISLVIIKLLLFIIRVESIFRRKIYYYLIRGVKLVIVPKTKLRVRLYLSFNDLLTSPILPIILSFIRFKIATRNTVSKLLRKFTFSSNILRLTILYINLPVSQIYQLTKLKELG